MIYKLVQEWSKFILSTGNVEIVKLADQCWLDDFSIMVIFTVVYYFGWVEIYSVPWGAGMNVEAWFRIFPSIIEKVFSRTCFYISPGLSYVYLRTCVAFYRIHSGFFFWDWMVWDHCFLDSIIIFEGNFEFVFLGPCLQFTYRGRVWEH